MFSFKSYKIHDPSCICIIFFYILLHLPFHEHVERRKNWEGNLILQDSDIV